MRATIALGQVDLSTPELKLTVPGAGRNLWGMKVAKIDATALELNLSLSIKNRGSKTCEVWLKGGATRVPITTDEVVLSAGSNSLFGFSVACMSGGTQTVFDNAMVSINHYWAAVGGLTIPAIPITIVYEPPMDRRRMNTAEYTAESFLGTTASWSVSSETSSSRPAEPSEFENNNDFASALSVAGGALQKAPNPYAVAAGAAISILSEGLGSAQASETTSTRVTRGGATALEWSSGSSTTTGAQMGPGQGDIFVFWRNARVAWLRGPTPELKMYLMGADSLSKVTASVLISDLRELRDQGASAKGARTGLDAQTIRSLLALDPFVPWLTIVGPNTPGVNVEAASTSDRMRADAVDFNVDSASYTDPSVWKRLKSARFQYRETLDAYGGMINEEVVKATDDQGQFTSRATSESKVEDYEKGFLSALGLAPDETKTVSAIQTSTYSAEQHEGRTTRAVVRLHTLPDERYAVHVYYDTVFSTFALVEVPTASKPRVTGRLSGGGAPGTRVELTVGGKKYITRTLTDGTFAFYANDIAESGNATLKVDKRHVDFKVGPNVNVTVPR